MDGLKARQAPRTAVVWSVVTAELRTELDCGEPGEPCRIVDVGGGTGGFAVPLAEAGHHVTVVDTSPNALAALTRRASESGAAERISAVQGDADALAELIAPGSVRLVLCHSVLEMVDSPQAAVQAIASVLAPGGAASIQVANRAGAVLSRALGGHLSAATAILNDKDGRSGERDTLLRRFDPASISSLMEECGLVSEQLHGIQVVADLVPGSLREAEPGAEQAMRAFELATATTPPYRDIATQLHVLARKPA